MPIILSIKADALRYVELWSVILSPSLKYPPDSNPPHEDMQFTIRSVFFVLLAVFSATMALPVLTSRDVFDPPITYPTAGSIFEAGETITVRWCVSIFVGEMKLYLTISRYRDTSSLPQGLPNKGLLVLGMLSQGSENLQLGELHDLYRPRACTHHMYDRPSIGPRFLTHGRSQTNHIPQEPHNRVGLYYRL